MSRRLPVGSWIKIEDLDPGTTDRELVKFLRDHGVDIPLTHVIVERPGSATICIQQDQLSALLKKVVGNSKLRNHAPVFEPFSWSGIR